MTGAELQADRVVVPEAECRCKGRFIVLHIVGEPHDRIMHTKPPCEHYEQLKGDLVAFLHWVETGEDDDKGKGVTVNRRIRRKMARGNVELAAAVPQPYVYRSDKRRERNKRKAERRARRP